MLHISKIGQGRRINHPREVLKEGQKLTVTIEEVDPERRRIAAGHGFPGRRGNGFRRLRRTSPASMGTFGDLLRAGLEKKKNA